MREYADRVHLHELSIADVGIALTFRKRLGRGEEPVCGLVPHGRRSPFAIDFEQGGDPPVLFWTKDGKRIADGFTVAALLPHGWLIVWLSPSGGMIDAFSVPYVNPSQLIRELDLAGCKVDDPAACLELLETLRPRVTLNTERIARTKKTSSTCVRA